MLVYRGTAYECSNAGFSDIELCTYRLRLAYPCPYSIRHHDGGNVHYPE
jgi:hypothetical protein